MGAMPDIAAARSAQLAQQFEAAQDGFIRLIESLTDDQWRLVGQNHPTRINDEDEGRTVGVIAHHAAISGPWIMARIQTMLEGRPLEPADFHALNAQHAIDHANATPAEVLAILRDGKPRLAEEVRQLTNDQLDIQRDTPVGPMSVEQRIERILIGHLSMHQGSIEATIA